MLYNSHPVSARHSLWLCCLFMLLRVGLQPLYLAIAGGLCVRVAWAVSRRSAAPILLATSLLVDSFFAWLAFAAVLLIPYEASNPATSSGRSKIHREGRTVGGDLFYCWRPDQIEFCLFYRWPQSRFSLWLERFEAAGLRGYIASRVLRSPAFSLPVIILLVSLWTNRLGEWVGKRRSVIRPISTSFPFFAIRQHNFPGSRLGMWFMVDTHRGRRRIPGRQAAPG